MSEVISEHWASGKLWYFRGMAKKQKYWAWRREAAGNPPRVPFWFIYRP